MLVFWEKGFVGTTLKDIQHVTGVFKSGLYSEFKDKEDLFLSSIKHYKETHPSRKILSREPLGWGNIHDFLRALFLTDGQKGDFVASTIRELSILPELVRKEIEATSISCVEEMLKNVQAAGVQNEAYQVLDFLATFHYGLTIKVKLQPLDSIEKEIDQFMTLLASTK